MNYIINQKVSGLLKPKKKNRPLLCKALYRKCKMNLKSQLDNIVIEKPDGTTIDLGEKYGKQKGTQKKNS